MLKTCASQTNPNAISTAVVRITPIIRHIVTEQALGALEPSKAIALWRLLRNADAGDITRKPTAVRGARIVTALGSLATCAYRAGRSSSAAARVLVRELASATAYVEVGAVGVIRDAGHVLATRSDLEAAVASLVWICEDLEAEGGEDGDICPGGRHVEQH